MAQVESMVQVKANRQDGGMTRRAFSVFAGALALGLAGGALTGCGSGGQTASGEDALASIKQRGEMVFATEGTWRPWTYHDENDELVGYDVEVARAVAERMGVEASFVEGEWDGLFAGVDSGRYDAVANGVDVTDERREAYDFSEPYAYSRTVVIVRAGDDRISSFEDLDGMLTANTVASTYAEVAERYGAQVQSVDDLNQTLELLEQGRIDATLNSDVVFYDYMSQRPDAGFAIAAEADEATPVAFPVKKGEASASLLEEMNTALDDLRESGELTSLSERYFGADITEE